MKKTKPQIRTFLQTIGKLSAKALFSSFMFAVGLVLIYATTDVTLSSDKGPNDHLSSEEWNRAAFLLNELNSKIADYGYNDLPTGSVAGWCKENLAIPPAKKFGSLDCECEDGWKPMQFEEQNTCIKKG